MTYDYKCNVCGLKVEEFRAYEDRHTPSVCVCGGEMEYQFPIQAAKNFQPFVPMHVESLGVDVHGRRERQQIMRHYGVIEAGDSVGGRLSLETSEHAHMMKPQELQGIRLSDVQRRQELGHRAKEEFRIGVVEKESKRIVTSAKSVTELPSAMKGKKRVRLVA